jgi:hypothetical protein
MALFAASPTLENAHAENPPSATKEGLIPLFNGTSFEGWTQKGGKAEYKIENGEVIGLSKKKTANSFMCTDKMYSNFILEYDFKVDPTLNSGVQIRSNSYPEEKTYTVKDGDKTKEIKVAANRVHGYQVEIDPSPRAWTAGIYDEGRRGWLAENKDKPEAQQSFKQNEWNHIRVECNGDSIKTWLNGVACTDLKDDLTATGFIALQVHSIKAEQPDDLEIRWKNIMIKELP